MLTALTTSYRGGFLRLFSQYVEQIPIPHIVGDALVELQQLASLCQDAAEKRRDLLYNFGHEILRDLAPGGLPYTFPVVLQNWPLLDFAAFRTAVKKHFKQDIPQAERNDWEAKLIAGAKRVAELTAQIESAEREIDQIVYRLFDLTPDEIALIEAAVQ